jgi:hypothetical protein
VTYILSCKWSIVHKDDVDDFFEVLRWSKEFGVDTPNGRQVKQGVMGVFAAGTFDPREHVKIKDGTSLLLPTYAARMNIQLFKASDFNAKLHERGCALAMTVQKVCRVARDEKEIRIILEMIWKEPGNSEAELAEVEGRNQDLFEFERSLEMGPVLSPEMQLTATPRGQEA